MRADLAKIRALRQVKNLSQATVAARLGYRSAVAYCRLETGQRRIRLEHLSPLAELLGVDVSELLTTNTVAEGQRNA